MIIGVTGPAGGIDQRQVKPLIAALQGCTELHHGACTGADEIAVTLARAVEARPRKTRDPWWINGATASMLIVGHPGDIPAKVSLQALDLSDIVLPAKGNLARDGDIASCVQRLVSVPSGVREVRRDGVWATMRYADKAGVPVLAIWPDGSQDYWRKS